jgi:hypothetical protein
MVLDLMNPMDLTELESTNQEFLHSDSFDPLSLL